MNIEKKKFENIVFDLDGTLADTIPIICDAFNHVVSPYTKRIHSESEIVTYFGPPEEEILAKFLPVCDVSLGMERLYTFYEENAYRVNLYEGLPDLLNVLNENNKKLGIFTGKNRRGTDITLSQLGVTSFFEFCITGSDVKRPKPDPEGMLKILALMNAKKDETIFIGDSKCDILSGNACDVSTGFVMWGNQMEEDASKTADYVFHSVVDMVKFLSGS